MTTELLKVDSPRWASFLARTPHDIYHLPVYLKTSTMHEGGEPCAFHVAEGESELLVPLLVRPMPRRLGAPTAWRDAMTPYGYACPLISPKTRPEDVPGLFSALYQAARKAGIVTMFLRFHPLMHMPMDGLASAGTLVEHGQTVTIDLSLSPAEMWAQTRQNHRRNLRRLEKKGFRAVMDDWEMFPEFVRIYRQTMLRLNAEERYNFSDDYFRALRTGLNGQLHLCMVQSPGGQLASGGLFTVCNGIIQYFLGGTDAKFLPMAPSKAIFDYVRLWGRERGDKLLHLGGGLGGFRDQLFDFKAGFSRQRATFHSLRVVLNEQAYARMLQLSTAHGGGCVDNRSAFFPPYRLLQH